MNCLIIFISGNDRYTSSSDFYFHHFPIKIIYIYHLNELFISTQFILEIYYIVLLTNIQVLYELQLNTNYKYLYSINTLIYLFCKGKFFRRPFFYPTSIHNNDIIKLTFPYHIYFFIYKMFQIRIESATNCLETWF